MIGRAQWFYFTRQVTHSIDVVLVSEVELTTQTEGRNDTMGGLCPETNRASLRGSVISRNWLNTVPDGITLHPDHDDENTET
jgi:hypothetical protein